MRKALALVLLVSARVAAEEADSLPQSLTGQAGDAARGRAIIVSRQSGLCLLCHSGPFAEIELQGDLAPSLEGVGSRLSAGQLRLRLVDARRVNPDSLMPSYFRTDQLRQVAPPFAGKPLLNAGEIEDVVAFLGGLR